VVIRNSADLAETTVNESTEDDIVENVDLKTKFDLMYLGLLMGCKATRDTHDRTHVETAVNAVIEKLQTDDELDKHVTANFFTDGIGWLELATDYENQFNSQNVFDSLLNDFNNERKVAHVDELYYKNVKDNKMETTTTLDEEVIDVYEEAINDYEEELNKATDEYIKAAEKASNQNVSEEECGIVCFVRKHSTAFTVAGVITAVGIAGYAYMKYYMRDTVLDTVLDTEH
jgi:hypothetical protein